MRTLMRFFAVFFCLSLFAQQSSVTIIGTSNVNTFRCTSSAFDTHVFDRSGLPAGNPILIKTKSFACSIKSIDKDFQQALHSETYPLMEIRLVAFYKDNADTYSGTAEVKIMNVEKKYRVTFTRKDNFYVGQFPVKFSDFGMIPPRKFGGMITVRDNLSLLVRLKYTD